MARDLSEKVGTSSPPAKRECGANDDQGQALPNFIVSLPTHLQMDKALLSAIDQLPSLASTVTALHTAASAALHSARSATAFRHAPHLASRRIQRAENLLRHLRASLAEFCASHTRLVSALRATLASPQRFPTAGPSATKPRWDRLSDEWWRERAEGVLTLVDVVAGHVDAVKRQLEGGGDYVGRLERVAGSAELAARAWQKVVRFVEKWEAVARAVADGLAEEGSLLTL